MKVKIEKVSIPVGANLTLSGKEEHIDFYTVQYKYHWYQTYKFVYDEHTNVPRLFKDKDEINLFFSSAGFEEII